MLRTWVVCVSLLTSEFLELSEGQLHSFRPRVSTHRPIAARSTSRHEQEHKDAGRMIGNRPSDSRRSATAGSATRSQAKGLRMSCSSPRSPVTSTGCGRHRASRGSCPTSRREDGSSSSTGAAAVARTGAERSVLRRRVDVRRPRCPGRGRLRKRVALVGIDTASPMALILAATFPIASAARSLRGLRTPDGAPGYEIGHGPESPTSPGRTSPSTGATAERAPGEPRHRR